MGRFPLSVGALLLPLLAACGKAPDGGAGEPAVAGKSLPGVAFTYAYSFMLPSARIADLQDQHAQACEALGAARCRITGLRYSVGRDGTIDASLSVLLDAPLARRFGRAGVQAAEALGATLTGADITGTDVAADAASNATQVGDNAADAARIERALARPDMPAEERAELLRQQAAVRSAVRAARDTGAEQRARLANTPLSFAYATGRGSGLADRARDAGDTALASIGMTLTAVLWVLAALGPPLVAAGIAYLLWRRWGRHWWEAVLERADRGGPPPPA